VWDTSPRNCFREEGGGRRERKESRRHGIVGKISQFQSTGGRFHCSVSFIAEVRSLIEQCLQKNLQVFKVLHTDIETIRSSLTMNIYDEYWH
jgi:hypothetical protein